MTDPIKTPMIHTRHFGREMPLISVLLALAAQEGNDGDEGNAMQMAADVLTKLTAENERLLIMADEPTTKRVWDGIQAMAGLFTDPDHMPTVLEFKAAFDAAFVVDGKPYDVERIKAEWQADYAAMTLERDQMRAVLTGLADLVQHECGVEPCAASMSPAEHYLGLARNLLQPKEPTHG